jgi:hypothetical protein
VLGSDKVDHDIAPFILISTYLRNNVLRSDKVDVVTLGLILQLQHKVPNLLCLHTRDQMFSPVLRIRIRVDPHQSGKLDPDPHQSEKVEALEGHFKALEGPNLGKVSGRIRIKLNGRIRFRIRMRVFFKF